LRKSLNTNLLKYTGANIKESYIRFFSGWSDAVNSLTSVQEGYYTGYGVAELTRVANEIQRIYVTDIVNEVKLPKKINNGTNWKPTEEEIEKANFMETVEKITGNNLIELIMKDLPQKASFYNLDNTPELTTQLESLDNQFRENLIRVNEIKFKKLLILTMNSTVNLIAIKKPQGKPSEYQDFYDNCKFLLNRRKKAGMNLYLEEEYEGVLTNSILVSISTSTEI
jgi:poly-D-alanine transfer protein DltD